MNNQVERYHETYTLEKGFVYFSQTPVAVHTVLGSAVSVCIWDTENKYGAINHFVKPQPGKNELPTPTFGNAAMVAIVKLMAQAGSKTKNLVAQIFGGAAPMEDTHHSIGKENIEMARTYLKQKKIRVVSEDVGGNLGRKIVFDTSTGRAAVLKIDQIRKSDWQ